MCFNQWENDIWKDVKDNTLFEVEPYFIGSHAQNVKLPC